MKNTHSIYILLSRHYDFMANVIYRLTGRGYTHASIGLVEEETSFYSFNFKGFRKEQPRRWREKSNKNEIGMMLYELSVTEEAYENIKKKIAEFKERQAEYRYSQLGLVLCYFHIPHKIKNHYFCSQFVAEMLLASGEIALRDHPSVYMPNGFVKEFHNDVRVSRVEYEPMF